jgi:hypothetical protein
MRALATAAASRSMRPVLAGLRTRPCTGGTIVKQLLTATRYARTIMSKSYPFRWACAAATARTHGSCTATRGRPSRQAPNVLRHMCFTNHQHRASTQASCASLSTGRRPTSATAALRLAPCGGARDTRSLTAGTAALHLTVAAPQGARRHAAVDDARRGPVLTLPPLAWVVTPARRHVTANRVRLITAGRLALPCRFSRHDTAPARAPRTHKNGTCEENGTRKDDQPINNGTANPPVKPERLHQQSKGDRLQHCSIYV